MLKILAAIIICFSICLQSVNAQVISIDSLHRKSMDTLELFHPPVLNSLTKTACVCILPKFRHHIISLNIADYILQKYNIQYDYLPASEKWRIRGYTFVDVKDQNYGLAVNAYSNWKISKHVTHLIGGSLQGEYIGSFYQDFYLKFRPTGYAIDPDFATGLVFTAADRFVFGIDAAVGPGMVFRDDRFKGVFLDLRLGLSVGVKF